MPRKPLPREEPEETGADPDRLLAVLAYMANATPGTTRERLSSAVARETGYVLSPEDAEEALQVYSGAPRKDDLDWFGEDKSPDAIRQTVSAALRVGQTGGGVSREGRRTLSSIARAVGMSAEELAELLPERTTGDGPAYAPFPIADDVSHWIGRMFRPLIG